MIAIGCDHGGFDLKEFLSQKLKESEVSYKDFGCYSPSPVDYPEIAEKLSRAVVASGTYEFGILICGTGLGVSIAANKISGVRAALCSDCYSARMAREHNDANIIALGGRVLGHELAWEIVNTFLNAGFQEGIHASRVATINALR